MKMQNYVIFVKKNLKINMWKMLLKGSFSVSSPSFVKYLQMTVFKVNFELNG